MATLVILCLWCIGLGLLRLWDRRSLRRRAGWGLSIVALFACAFRYNFRVVRVTAPQGETVKLPGEREPTEIFTSRHRNVYRTFDYKTENCIQSKQPVPQTAGKP